MHTEKFIRVDEWKPSKEESVVKYDGKLIIIPFDKIFNDPAAGVLNVFNIAKNSCVSKLDSITNYINYFIKFYDEDNELLFAYAKLKYVVQDKKKKVSLPTFVQMVYSILLSDSIREKIVKMTEDNYYINVESDDGKTYDESLEFTNEHAKVMMEISIAMKMMIPIMFHYINKLKYDRNKRKEKDRDKKVKEPNIKEKKIIFRFYEGLFDVFGPDMEIYNKLCVSVVSKVKTHYLRNKVMWDKRVMFGTNEISQIDELLHEKIICEAMFKYVFNKNVVSFNHVILRNQFRFFKWIKYRQNRIEVSNNKDVNGLSGLDKLEMNATKIDESIVILSETNIKKTIKRIEQSMNMKVTKAEVAYYRENMVITKFQVKLVYYFYAKYFGSYRDLNFINRTKYIKLLAMLKRRLQLQGFIYLPLVLTANIDGRLNPRTIRNAKFLNKIESSSIYQTIITDKYPTLSEIGKEDTIINTLSTIINTKFTFVEYDSPEKLGEAIDINSDIVSDEFLNYLNQL